MTHTLELRDVVRTYPGAAARGRPPALQGISLTLAPGSFVGLLGPNGAGKTTLLRCAAGLLRPDRGEVAWFGRVLPRRLPRSVAFVADSPAYYAFFTVREAVEYYAALHDVPPAERGAAASHVLEAVALAPHADKRVGELSRGMTQRLGLAQALAGRPKLLLLDETLAGLDPVTRRVVCELLRRLVRDGCSVVLSTHDVAALEQVADRVIVQQDGRFIHEVDPRTLTWARWLALEVPEPAAAAQLLADLRPWVHRGTLCVPLDGRSPESVLATVRAAGVAPLASRVETDDLEARYLAAITASSTPDSAAQEVA
ncbi:MAG: ABC transporter ATP-binding protein [Gemmatimonadaceae bacterium]|nr:ABC transporter ATP-binding protein [Gemmatimonadaceae bacterium]